MSRNCKLGDIAELSTGPFGSQLHKSDYVNIGIPVIMPQNINNLRNVDYSGIVQIKDSDYQRLCRHALLEDDIVFARRGEVDKHALISKSDLPMLCGTGCLRVRVTDGMVNPRYLSQYLNKPEVKARLRQHAVGSNMPNLNTGILAEIPIRLPDKSEQDTVVDLLDTIDNKIRTNQRICKELEDTARLIYDYWFTQFDFPDENGNPYRSSGGKMRFSKELKRNIPLDWKVVTINDLIHIQKGISYKSKDLLGGSNRMINLASFSTNGSLKIDGLKSYSGAVDIRKIVTAFDLVMCITQQTDIDLTGATNVIGKTFIVPPVSDKTLVISTDVAKIIPNKPNVVFMLDQFFKRSDIHRYLVGFANGTKIKHLDIAAACSLKIPIPPSESSIPERFANLSKTFASHIGKALQENKELSHLRDQLLPMLMNGQVKIAESEFGA